VEDQSLTHLSIRDFLDRLASADPTPGGGSAAALVGAHAAALGEMVAALTVGKAKFADVAPQVKGVAARLRKGRELLTRLIDEDANAYQALSEALRRPKDDPKREELIAERAMVSGGVPLQTAAVTACVLADLEAIQRLGNPLLRSDAEAGIRLARAAVRAAAANVKANLPLMDQTGAQQVESELAGIMDSLSPQGGT
jgi:formiminotetrahydrofolate cyclodeaminase